MAKLISQIYGQALFELATQEDKVPAMFGEVKTLKAALLDGDYFIRFMKNPRITQDEKQKVIADSLTGKVSSDMLGFLHILVQKERMSEIEGIFDYFIRAVDKQTGKGHAKVTAPLRITELQKDAIREKLLATTGFKEIDIEYETDPALIGGIVIRVGDRVVDGSIQTRLYELKRQLM